MNTPEEHKNSRLKALLDQEGTDDFEKEAREGFAAMDKEEAMALKTELDQRMQAGLFDKKTDNKTMYWLAAAGMFLVVGLSVYLMLATKTDDRLAVNDKSSPTSAISEPLSGQAPKSIKDPLDITHQNPGRANATAVDKNRHSPSEANRLSKPEAEVAVAQTQEQQAVIAEPAADLAMAPTTANVAGGAPQPSALNVLSAGKTVAEELEAPAPPPSVSPAKTPSESARGFKKVAKSDATAYAATGATAQPHYAGGDESLIKDIRQLLTEIKLNRRFDAMLSIDRQNKVQKVEFTNPYDLQPEELQQIKKALLGLDKFVTPPNASGLMPFMVNYRP